MSSQKEHLTYLKEALKLAKTAFEKGEVPVGAVIVKDGEIIGKGFNQREMTGDATAHAEILAIKQACETLGTFRLLETTLYITMEPCPMCAGAIVNSRISHVVYAADDPKAGAAKSLFTILNDPRLNHRCKVTSGVMAKESEKLLKDFFAELRLKKAKNKNEKKEKQTKSG